ncbi:MAG: hypothetical protein KAJ14_16640, partial [Candidatus Omnitrophica bacterium]|nr:hypothetical protein [Candidatus Omnitrophota bacterium]
LAAKADGGDIVDRLTILIDNKQRSITLTELESVKALLPMKFLGNIFLASKKLPSDSKSAWNKPLNQQVRLHVLELEKYNLKNKIYPREELATMVKLKTVIEEKSLVSLVDKQLIKQFNVRIRDIEVNTVENVLYPLDDLIQLEGLISKIKISKNTKNTEVIKQQYSLYNKIVINNLVASPFGEIKQASLRPIGKEMTKVILSNIVKKEPMSLKEATKKVNFAVNMLFVMGNINPEKKKVILSDVVLTGINKGLSFKRIHRDVLRKSLDENDSRILNLAGKIAGILKGTNQWFNHSDLDTLSNGKIYGLNNLKKLTEVISLTKSSELMDKNPTFQIEVLDNVLSKLRAIEDKGVNELDIKQIESIFTALYVDKNPAAMWRSIRKLIDNVYKFKAIDLAKSISMSDSYLDNYWTVYEASTSEQKIEKLISIAKSSDQAAYYFDMVNEGITLYELKNISSIDINETLNEFEKSFSFYIKGLFEDNGELRKAHLSSLNGALAKISNEKFGQEYVSIANKDLNLADGGIKGLLNNKKAEAAILFESLVNSIPQKLSLLKGVDPILEKIGGPEYLVNPEGFFKQWEGASTNLEQGWKIHISALPTNAGEVLDVVLPILQKDKILHKVIKGIKELKKYNSSIEQGKFITVYPHSDEEAVMIAKKLDNALAFKNIKAPEVLTDKKYDGKSGLVYYRYGQLKEGDFHDWDGNSVKDIREKGRYKPDFVKIDPFEASRYLSGNKYIISEKYLQEIFKFHETNFEGKVSVWDLETNNEIEVTVNQVRKLYNEGRAFGYDEEDSIHIMINLPLDGGLKANDVALNSLTDGGFLTSTAFISNNIASISASLSNMKFNIPSFILSTLEKDRHSADSLIVNRNIIKDMFTSSGIRQELGLKNMLMNLFSVNRNNLLQYVKALEGYNIDYYRKESIKSSESLMDVLNANLGKKFSDIPEQGLTDMWFLYKEFIFNHILAMKMPVLDSEDFRPFPFIESFNRRFNTGEFFSSSIEERSLSGVPVINFFDPVEKVAYAVPVNTMGYTKKEIFKYNLEDLQKVIKTLPSQVQNRLELSLGWSNGEGYRGFFIKKGKTLIDFKGYTLPVINVFEKHRNNSLLEPSMVANTITLRFEEKVLNDLDTSPISAGVMEYADLLGNKQFGVLSRRGPEDESSIPIVRMTDLEEVLNRFGLAAINSKALSKEEHFYKSGKNLGQQLGVIHGDMLIFNGNFVKNEQDINYVESYWHVGNADGYANLIDIVGYTYENITGEKFDSRNQKHIENITAWISTDIKRFLVGMDMSDDFVDLGFLGYTSDEALKNNFVGGFIEGYLPNISLKIKQDDLLGPKGYKTTGGSYRSWARWRDAFTLSDRIAESFVKNTFKPNNDVIVETDGRSVIDMAANTINSRLPKTLTTVSPIQLSFGHDLANTAAIPEKIFPKVLLNSELSALITDEGLFEDNGELRKAHLSSLNGALAKISNEKFGQEYVSILKEDLNLADGGLKEILQVRVNDHLFKIMSKAFKGDQRRIDNMINKIRFYYETDNVSRKLINAAIDNSLPEVIDDIYQITSLNVLATLKLALGLKELHGSLLIDEDGKGVLILGEKETGKSTLSALFVKQGLSIGGADSAEVLMNKEGNLLAGGGKYTKSSTWTYRDNQRKEVFVDAKPIFKFVEVKKVVYLNLKDTYSFELIGDDKKNELKATAIAHQKTMISDKNFLSDEMWNSLLSNSKIVKVNIPREGERNYSKIASDIGTALFDGGSNSKYVYQALPAAYEIAKNMEPLPSDIKDNLLKNKNTFPAMWQLSSALKSLGVDGENRTIKEQLLKLNE